jgi:signal transduction histidine kinase
LAFLGRDRGLPGLPEEQLLRILGEDCLLSLPLCQGTRCLGVLVAGIPAWRIAELKKREKLLLAFGAKLAQALHALTQDRSAFEGSLAEVRAGYIESSRRVAHEVNNPLTIIKNYLGVLDDKLNRHEPVTGELSIIHEEIDRVGGLVREFAGAQPRAQTGRTDLNRIISDMVRLFRESRFLPATVQITAQLPAQACDISSPADTLKQILMNLVKNAIEALPAGGQIELINAGRVHHDGQVYCKLCVRDNGAGLPEDVLARLFSPVASAKAGENRGIGLSIVNELIKKQGGRISCASSASGTSFEVFLPVARAPHAMEAS